MSQAPFVDHYEVMQLSQGADNETLERVFRLLAKRYHPDNPESGSEEAFREVHDAYEVLTDPARRAAYDVQYDKNRSMQWQVFDQDSTRGSHSEDQKIFSGVFHCCTRRGETTPSRVVWVQSTWRESWASRASISNFPSGT